MVFWDMKVSLVVVLEVVSWIRLDWYRVSGRLVLRLLDDCLFFDLEMCGCLFFEGEYFCICELMY